MKSVRTDLALEAHEMLEEECEGVIHSFSEKDGIKTDRVKILNEDGEKALNKPIGNYVTIETEAFVNNETEKFDEISSVISTEIKSMLSVYPESHVLVAGLGNRFITPDSIGPKTVSSVLVTRHIKEFMPKDIQNDLRPVSAVAPGVLGLTGIETAEIIKGIAERVRPDAVIVIDALASRSLKRLGSAIQIADTGISPGSGVGNNRKEISKNTLGIPVIAIGVPMVVDARTLAMDVVEETIKNIDEKEKYQELSDTIKSSETESMIVTPKEIDTLAQRVSKVVADAINTALQPSISKEEIESIMS